MAIETVNQSQNASSDARHKKDVDAGVLMLNEVDGRLETDCKKLRALAIAIMRLLPATIEEQRVFYLNDQNTLTPVEHQEALWTLRNGVGAARDLADMIDDIACCLGDRAQDELAQARQSLGLPPPAWTMEARKALAGE